MYPTSNSVIVKSTMFSPLKHS